MQRSEHGSRHQSLGPDHPSRPDEKSASQSRKSIAQDLGREDEQQLVSDANFLFVEVCLLHNDICCKGKSEGDIAADIHAAVFFLVPPPLGQP